MEKMDSAALKRHLCQNHFEKIRHGVLSVEEFKHSEVENQHCASNLIIPHTNEVQLMPTRCELSRQGKSLRNLHRCLNGKQHCSNAVSNYLCPKMSNYYEKTLPLAGHTVENGIDMSKCEELLENLAVFSCDEVKTTHKEPHAIKVDFYYIVIKKEASTGRYIWSKVEFVISIKNHAICGARLELRQN